LSWRIDSPTATPTIVTLNPAAQGQQPVPVPPGSHVVYATVIDSDAPIPPTSSTVQYPTVIVNKLPVLVVQDDWTSKGWSAAVYANAFQAAVNTIYSTSKTPTMQSGITIAKMSAYNVVIWAAPGDHGYDVSPRETPYTWDVNMTDTTKDEYKMKAYLDQGGYMMVHAGNQPYWRTIVDASGLTDRCGWVPSFGQNYWPKSIGNLYWYSGSYGDPTVQSGYPTYTGQGGTIGTVNLTGGSGSLPYEYTMVQTGDWNGGSATVPVANDGWSGSSYLPGLMRSNVGTSQQGKTLWIAWNFSNIIGVNGDTSNPANAQKLWMQNCLNALGITAP